MSLVLEAKYAAFNSDACYPFKMEDFEEGSLPHNKPSSVAIPEPFLCDRPLLSYLCQAFVTELVDRDLDLPYATEIWAEAEAEVARLNDGETEGLSLAVLLEFLRRSFAAFTEEEEKECLEGRRNAESNASLLTEPSSDSYYNSDLTSDGALIPRPTRAPA